MSRTVKELQAHFNKMVELGYGDDEVNFVFIPEDGGDAEDLSFGGCMVGGEDGRNVVIGIMNEDHNETELTISED